MKRALSIFGVSIFALACGASGAAQETPTYRLTLREAIEKGLKANLSVLVANTRVEESQGTRARRLSAALLPRVSNAKLRQPAKS